MLKELVILDLDDTLEDIHGVFPSVSEFLERQASKRECIIATFADAMVEGSVGRGIREFTKGFYPRQVVARGYEYCQDGSGRLLHEPKLYNERSTDKEEVYVPYENPFLEEYIMKDLHLVKRLHGQKNNCEYQRAVFVADHADVHAACTDPTIPCLFVRDRDWARRGIIEAMGDRLFEGSPADVFDKLYSKGKPVPDRVAEFMGRIVYRSGERTGGRLRQSVEINIENFRYRMSKMIDNLEARVIQELI